MIVVSDTTPLRHLIAIGEVDLLQTIFGAVIVPEVVWSELQSESTPAAVKAWIREAPEWLQVRASGVPTPEDFEVERFDQLDSGEQAAIRLAVELRADFLLIDEADGRTFALGLGLPVTGTLGLLERADVLGLLADLPATLAQLEASGFYLSARLREAVVARHRRRRKV